MMKAALLLAFASTSFAELSIKSPATHRQLSESNSSSSSTEDGTDYTVIMDDLWAQADADGDDKLSVDEFGTALFNLGLTVGPSKDLDLHDDVADLFAALDGGNGLTKQELMDAMTDFPSYRAPLTAALTGGSGGTNVNLVELISVDPAVTSAAGSVQMSFTLTESPSAIYAGTRAALIEYFADLAGVSVGSLIITFLPPDSRRRRRLSFFNEAPEEHLSFKRELQTAGSVVDVNVFVADETAIPDVEAALPATTDDVAAIPALSSFEVLAVEPPSSLIRYPPLPLGGMIIVAAALVGVGIFLCCTAKVVAAQKAKAKNEKSGDCCNTGCCSFNAVKPWAFGELVAAMCILGGVFWLYQNFGDITAAILGLLDVLLTLVNATNDAIAEFTSMVPTAIVDVLEQQRSAFELLPLAVMIPGILAALFLILSSACACTPTKKGTYCCTKFAMSLAYVFLLLCLIFYLIFIAIALALTLGPPAIKEPINMVQSLCISIPANLSQMRADALGLLDKLDAAGQDVSLIQETLGGLNVVIDGVVDGCGHIVALFQALFGLFLPGLICVVAIIFAFFVNTTFCCAAGCCSDDKTAKGAAGDKSTASV